MHLAFFYPNAFCADDTARNLHILAAHFPQAMQITLWGQLSGPPPKASMTISGMAKPDCRGYAGVRHLKTVFQRWLQVSRPECVVFVGADSLENRIASQLCHKESIPVIWHPVGALTENQPPIPEPQLKPSHELPKDTALTWQDWWEFKMAPRVHKLLTQKAVPKTLPQLAARVAVFSDAMKQTIQATYTLPDERFFVMLWGVDQPLVSSLATKPHAHLYRDVLGYKDNRLNFLCMLPKHWKTSDLQPLLLGIHMLRCDLGDKRLPFRLFVIDPHTISTERAITMAIKGLGLENDVLNLMSESYPADLLPILRDAGALIDLAESNTLPYPLRMATALGIPVMVSASTHFAGLVEQYQTGVVVNHPDAPNSVAFAIRQLATPDFWQSWSVNGREKLSQKLSWISIAERLIRQAEELAPENPTSLTG